MPIKLIDKIKQQNDPAPAGASEFDLVDAQDITGSGRMVPFAYPVQALATGVFLPPPALPLLDKFQGPRFTRLTNHDSANQNNHDSFGTTGEQRRAQGFKIGATLNIWRAYIWLKKVGAPTDNVVLEIQTDAAGVPSGTVVATSGSVAGSGLSTSYAWVDFTFSSYAALTAGTQYHLVAKRSGALDGTNYYQWGIDTSGGYGNGTESWYNGTAWAAQAGFDLCFEIYGAPHQRFTCTAGTAGTGTNTVLLQSTTTNPFTGAPAWTTRATLQLGTGKIVQTASDYASFGGWRWDPTTEWLRVNCSAVGASAPQDVFGYWEWE